MILLLFGLPLPNQVAMVTESRDKPNGQLGKPLVQDVSVRLAATATSNK